jgi:hypothetical protein
MVRLYKTFEGAMLAVGKHEIALLEHERWTCSFRWSFSKT